MVSAPGKLKPAGQGDERARQDGHAHNVSSKSLRDTGRWYLFACRQRAGGRLEHERSRFAQGQFQHLGWSAEGASALVSDAQAGVGWRKGDMQASVGYVHREIYSDPSRPTMSNPGTVQRFRWWPFP